LLSPRWPNFVALAFKRPEEGGDIVACDPKEARSSDQAIRMAGSLAAMEGHCGAIAFSRTGDPALGYFDDAVILRTIGESNSRAAEAERVLHDSVPGLVIFD
jgi:hypothetical protein